LIAAFATALASAQTATPEHRAEIKRAVYDLCPRIFAGEVLLTDPAQVATIGYKPTEPRDTPGGKVPRAEMGEGASKIVIAGHGGVDPSCAIWFGGPDSHEQIGYMLTDAGKAGFHVGSPMRTGDRTMVFNVARKNGQYKSMAVFVGDAGGEFGSEPAATVVLLK
jgi:hypothetical protein